MTKLNDTASDLWAQIFSRDALAPYATVIDPEYDEADEEPALREGLRDAGWNDQEIQSFVEAHLERKATAPTTSPGVNPHVEAAFARLCDDVEGSMDRLGFASHAKVARGIEPRVGPRAAKIGVIMTDESIVTVGSFMFRYCGLVARAFMRTLKLNPWLWDSPDYETGMGIELLKRSPDLVGYWMKIYFSFAVTGTHVGVPFRPSTREEVVLMEQVARAMEMFAIAHEYGHHHLGHGRNVEADPKLQEFEADQFALKICDEADRKPVIIENPYLISGAGGVVLLKSMNLLRVHEKLFGAKNVDFDTHPNVIERVNRFDSVRILKPKEFEWLKSFRDVSVRIMDAVSEILLRPLDDMSKTDLAGIRDLRQKMLGD